MKALKAQIIANGGDWDEFLVLHDNDVFNCAFHGDEQPLIDAVMVYDPTITAPTAANLIQNQQVYTGPTPTTPTSDSYISNSGRAYCNTDNRWITESDDNYGPGYYQWNEACGTGVDPITEWEHQGFMVPDGAVIKKLMYRGRANNTQVTDIILHAILRKPTPITRWETGLDADGEDVDTVILRDSFMNAAGEVAFTGTTTDAHLRIWDINATVNEPSYLSIYFQPVGTLTATRHFTSSYSWIIG